MTKTPQHPFDDVEHYPERIFIEGKCDDIVGKIAKECGWADEFKEKIQKCKS